LSLFNELKRRNVFRVGAAYVVAAWLLIQVVETIFPAFGFGDAAMRILVIVLAIGLVPVVLFAWAFELTPEGLKKESEVDRSQSITPQTGKRLDRAIMVVLALSLSYFAVDKFVLAPQREAVREGQRATAMEQAREQGRSQVAAETPDDPSIAVMPFVNMSEDPANEFFSDGISEELLNLLAKIPELRVISRTSAFSYKGKDIKLAQVAKELDVAHVLEGSVRKSGDKVRITAQLIEAETDSHLWSETYDRTLDDIFAVQDEIAAMVVERLRLTLLHELPTAHKVDPEAYALFLQARHLRLQGGAASREQARVLYEQVLTIEPAYAAAWDELARYYQWQANTGQRPWQEGYQMARESAAMALAADPEYAPALLTLSNIALYDDNDLAAATSLLQQALALQPDDALIRLQGDAILLALGRVEESIAVQQQQVARDPVNPTAHFNLGAYNVYAGHWDEAIAALETALRLSPGYYGAYAQIGTALLFKGDAGAALEAFGQEKIHSLRVKGEAMAFHALGRQADYQARLAELIEIEETEQFYSEVAQVYAYVGDADSAFAWLDKELAKGAQFWGHEVHVPSYRPIHDDPRWPAFLERVGCSPEQLAAVPFSVDIGPD